MTNEIEPRHSIPPAPIHPLAALATITLDNIFGLFEIIDPLVLILTSVTVGVVGMISTALIQHYLSREGWGASFAKGMAMGIIAGVPFQVVGTVVGVPLLAWAGLHEWLKISPAKRRPGLPEVDDEIIDVEAKPEIMDKE